MNETYFLALAESVRRELALRVYVESGEAEKDLARALESLAEVEHAFAEYEKQHGSKGGAL